MTILVSSVDQHPLAVTFDCSMEVLFRRFGGLLVCLFQLFDIWICRHGEHMPMMESALERFGSILIMSHHLHLPIR
jgi:hypothetical protein